MINFMIIQVVEVEIIELRLLLSNNNFFIQNMLKFLTSQNYRIKCQELEQIEMIGQNFKNFKHPSIRTYIRTLCRINSKEEFKEIFEIFYSLNQKKCPFQTLKILLFFHAMIQESPSTCEDILAPEINKLQQQIKKNEKHIRERGRSGSLEKKISRSVQKTVGWIKDKLSSSKQKQVPTNKYKNQSMKTQQNQIMSKEEFIMNKVINPYFAYLIRSLSLLSLYKKCQNNLTVEIHEVWMIISILKKILQISESFSHILRYYKENLLDLLLAVRKMVVYEINFLYPFMKRTVDGQIEDFMQSYLKEYDQMGKEAEEWDKFIRQNKVKDLKNLLEEISSINQSMKLLFFSKYYANLKMPPEAVPRIIDTHQNKCDILYYVLQQQDKHVEREKKKNCEERRRSKTELDESTSNISRTGNCMVNFKELRRRNIQSQIPQNRNKLKL